MFLFFYAKRKNGSLFRALISRLVLDLRIAHDRVGSSADPTLNGHLKYPNNLDQSLNDAAAYKIRKYRVTTTTGRSSREA